MKKQNHYICDGCHHEIPTNKVSAVTKSELSTAGWYRVIDEYHYCPACFQKVVVECRILEG